MPPSTLDELMTTLRTALPLLVTVAVALLFRELDGGRVKVSLRSKGTLDVLMETEWVRLRGRRRTPGRPVTYGTTEEFLVHFGLENVGDLPGAEELKAAGLLDGRLPPGFEVPTPSDSGGDGDGDFTDDEPLNEEYGAAMDEHLTAGGEEE